LGTPDVAASTLQAIYDASTLPGATFEVTTVVTQPPKRRKRKGKMEASPVGKVAEDLGLAVLCPEKANDKAFLDHLANEVRPDLCITAAYGQYLPKRFLATPACGTVNIHPSLLPRWRGASPVQRSLQAGDNPVGVTVLYTVSAMDAGPIIAQEEKEVDENDTAANVLPMLFELGTNQLLDKLPDILEGRITMETATPQDESQAVPAPLIHSFEGEFKVWEESATSCHNRLRGFSMWPGAFMYVQVGDREEVMKIKVTETRVVPGTAEPTNEVKLGPTKKDGLYVVCHDGSILELLRVQPATRKAFPARDFQNGYAGETIRWLETPADQITNPEKYNSRTART
jgi:methionyl-tRNA formyltransferase